MGEFIVSAGTPEKRMYWLQQLQKARREFSAGGAAAFRNSVNPHQVIIFLVMGRLGTRNFGINDEKPCLRITRKHNFRELISILFYFAI